MFFIRAISANLSTIVFPFFEWFVQGVALAAIIYFGLQLWTVGNPIHRIRQLSADKNCICSGEASNYTDNSICKLDIFEKYCQQIDTNKCSIANCTFDKFDPPQIVTYYKVNANNHIISNRIKSYLSHLSLDLSCVWCIMDVGLCISIQ